MAHLDKQREYLQPVLTRLDAEALLNRLEEAAQTGDANATKMLQHWRRRNAVPETTASK